MKDNDKSAIIRQELRKGRGARSNVSGRFETLSRSDFDDGWETLSEAETFKTKITEEKARSVLTRNQSPDVPFEQSINAYRGCEHGCPYCFARPSHAYMGLSPGLDFESQLFAKINAAEILRKELSSPRYQPKTIALGTNTDPYQPIERQYKITRSILEVCLETKHPVSIVTKSALVVRDIDILSELAKLKLIRVGLTVTSLDRKLARKLEPRASTPNKRLEALELLHQAQIPTMSLIAPIVPAVNDHEIENILKEIRTRGADFAEYVMIRLPLEIKELLEEWLETEFPDRAKKVYAHIRSMHHGQLYISNWGERQRGSGPYAEMIARRFEIAKKRLKFRKEPEPLRTDLFTRPKPETGQLELF